MTKALLLSLAAALTACAEAVLETITTPTPGFGHGHVADVVAAVTWITTNVHIF